MADFEKAYKIVAENEGNFANTQNDKGGATKYGISSRLLETSPLLKSYKDKLDTNKDGTLSPSEMEQLTPEDAEEIYKVFFWDANNYGKLSYQCLAYECFDFAITSGEYRANITLQSSINNIQFINRRPQINEDGLIGPITLEFANKLTYDSVEKVYKYKRKIFYESICKSDPTQTKFLKGWLKRIDKC